MTHNIQSQIRPLLSPDGKMLVHLGRNARTGEQVYVPLESFNLHCVIRGATGSQKTRLVVYLMLQIISIEDGPLFFLDFGADQFAFHALKDLCKRLRRPHSFVSTRQGDAGKHMDPAHIAPLTYETLVRWVNYLVSALSLHFGEGFSKAFFGDANYLLLQDALERCIHAGILHPTLEDIAARLYEVAVETRNKDALHTQMAFRMLLPYPQLFATGDPAKDMNIHQEIENGSVAVGFNNGLMEASPVAKIGGLLVWGYVLAMIDRAEKGKPRRTLTLVIEEFSVVAQSRSFQLLLPLARKFFIRILMIHQSEEQLRGDSRGVDLRPLIRDNTAVKVYLTSSGDDIEYLQDMSERLPKLKDGGHSKRGRSVATQSRYEEEPTVEYNDVLDASAKSGDFFLVHNSGTGHNDPIRVTFDPIYFPEYFTREVHDRLRNTPLPQRPNRNWSTRDDPGLNDSPERLSRIRDLETLAARVENAERVDFQ